MKSDQLIHALYKIGAIKFGEFKLKSGQTSKIYLDLRQIISYPDILRTVAETLWNKIKNQDFNILCGVPYTALPIATCMSLKNNIPMVMRRKEKKSYGTQQQIEGTFQPDQRCLIIEDVITSGASILETANELEAVGLKIDDAVVLINREQGGVENLQKKHITVHSVLTLDTILHELQNSDLLSEQECAIVTTLHQERA